MPNLPQEARTRIPLDIRVQLGTSVRTLVRRLRRFNPEATNFSIKNIGKGMNSSKSDPELPFETTTRPLQSNYRLAMRGIVLARSENESLSAEYFLSKENGRRRRLIVLQYSDKSHRPSPIDAYTISLAETSERQSIGAWELVGFGKYGKKKDGTWDYVSPDTFPLYIQEREAIVFPLHLRRIRELINKLDIAIQKS